MESTQVCSNSPTVIMRLKNVGSTFFASGFEASRAGKHTVLTIQYAAMIEYVRVIMKLAHFTFIS